MTECRTGIEGDRAVSLTANDRGNPGKVSRGPEGHFTGSGELENLHTSHGGKGVVNVGVFGDLKCVHP